MKRSTSRLLSTLLVLCMVLALLPGTAWAAETTVYAGTVEELKAALKSNTTIILEGKDYILEGEGYFDYYIDLSNLENVTIRGTTGTRIMSTSPFSNVISILGCKNIILDSLVLGHDIPASDDGCRAGVIYANGTEQLTITNCDIFGCGLVGIQGWYSSTIVVEKSTIRDCSEYILELVNGANMVFNNCVFSGNGYDMPGKYAISVTDFDRVSELALYNCTFRDNKNPHFTNGSPVVENCTFTNNVWESVVEIPVTGGNLYFSTATGAIVDCDSNVTEAVIPSVFNGVAVTGIGGGTFYGCYSLTSVIIPDSVTSIGSGAFWNCYSLTSVIIPDSVTSIGKGAFFDCRSLTSVTIPRGVATIDYNTFWGCSSLTGVTIPDSVTTIGEYAFYDCSRLTDVYYGGSESQWKQIEIDDTWSNAPLLNADIHYNSPMPSTPDTPDTPDEPDTPDTPTFTDVPAGEYYAEPVAWAVEKGITTGVSDGIFAPGTECTRAQIVTFLWRAYGKPKPTSTVNSFTDVKEGAYYYDAVLWAAEKGITTGVNSTTFDIDGSCTRAQAVTFLWRAAGKPSAASGGSFADVKDSAYYAEAVKWAVANSITNGVGNGFSPDNDCTRAQIVTFLYRNLAQ